jgi:hypothetical protein
MAKVLAAKGCHYQFIFARNAGHIDRAVKVTEETITAGRWLLLVLKSFSNLLHMRTVHSNSFVQLLAGYVKLVCPVVNIGRKLWIDLVCVVWSLCFRGVPLFRNCGLI